MRVNCDSDLHTIQTREKDMCINCDPNLHGRQTRSKCALTMLYIINYDSDLHGKRIVNMLQVIVGEPNQVCPNLYDR